MKHTFYLVAASLFLFTSCEKIKSLANVNVDLPYTEEFSTPIIDTTTKVPAGGIDFALPVQAVAINADEKLSVHNIEEQQISKVALKSFTQRICKTEDFDFVDSLKVYLSAKNLPEVLIATKSSIPDNTRDITFDCIDLNLREYFIQDSVYIRMQGHFNSMPHTATYTTNFEFSISANLANKE